MSHASNFQIGNNTLTPFKICFQKESKAISILGHTTQSPYPCNIGLIGRNTNTRIQNIKWELTTQLQPRKTNPDLANISKTSIGDQYLETLTTRCMRKTNQKAGTYSTIPYVLYHLLGQIIKHAVRSERNRGTMLIRELISNETQVGLVNGTK